MSAAAGRRPVGVAVAGFGWMGRVSTQAYARGLHHFPELPLAPELVGGGRLGAVFWDFRMGLDDLKVIEAWSFLRSIAEGTPHGTTLADAVRSPATLDAMASSADTGAWVKVTTR